MVTHPPWRKCAFGAITLLQQNRRIFFEKLPASNVIVSSVISRNWAGGKVKNIRGDRSRWPPLVFGDRSSRSPKSRGHSLGYVLITNLQFWSLDLNLACAALYSSEVSVHRQCFFSRLVKIWERAQPRKFSKKFQKYFFSTKIFFKMFFLHDKKLFEIFWKYIYRSKISRSFHLWGFQSDPGTANHSLEPGKMLVQKIPVFYTKCGLRTPRSVDLL